MNTRGFVGIASELVGVSDRYKGAVRFLLGRIAVASDLDTAADIAKKYRYKFRIVTLDGQQINAGGSFTGGSAARSQGILSRRGEAEALKREADAIRARKEAASRKEAAARQELQTLTRQLEEVRGRADGGQRGPRPVRRGTGPGQGRDRIGRRPGKWPSPPRSGRGMKNSPPSRPSGWKTKRP